TSHSSSDRRLRLAVPWQNVTVVSGSSTVRVGTAATRFGAERLAVEDTEGLAGLFQLSYLIDVLACGASFVIVASLAPLVGPRLVGADGALLIFLYALTLLISTADESSVSVLRLLDRFRLLAACSASVEGLRVAAVAGALLI